MTRLRSIAILSLAVTVAAVAIQFFWARSLGLESGLLTGDSRGYMDLARNLLDHGVFSAAHVAPFYPESFRSPGFPAFLAGLLFVFQSPWAALFAHAVMASLAPVFAYLALRDLHERAAFWGAVIFTFEPIRLFLAASFLSDTLFTVLFLASLVTLQRVSGEYAGFYLAGTGFVLGAMILVRPIAIFLPVLYAVYVIWDAKVIRAAYGHAIVVLLATALIVVPWMYRNSVLFGSWSVASVGAANLMLYNAPEFLKWHPDERAKGILSEFQAEQSALPREDALSLKRSETFTTTFREIIRGAEVQYVFFHVFKTLPFFMTDGLRDTARLFKIEISAMPNISTSVMNGDFASVIRYVQTGGSSLYLFVIGVGFWSIVTVVFFCSVIVSLVRRNWSVVWVAILVVYFALLTGPVSNARYRVPIESILIIVSAHGLLRWYDSRNRTSDVSV